MQAAQQAVNAMHAHRHLEDTQQVAQSSIDLYEIARGRYTDLLRVEMALEAERAVVKLAAILRLMQQPNPTAKDGKLHSASSAEAVVETDEVYAAHLLNQRNITHSKNRAATEAETAHLQAELALAMLKSACGVI